MMELFKSVIVKILFVFLILQTTTYQCFSQTFDKISNKEGFNQNTINFIEQDQYGFFWFGTPNGLIKFDGYEFKTFTTQSKSNGSLDSNFIAELYNDKNGILWIGTNLGINLYIPSKEKFITLPLPEKFIINKISEDANGNIWFSGEKQLFVCKIINFEKEIFEISENLNNTKLKGVEITDFSFKDENTLILTTNAGLKKVQLDKDKTLSFPKIKSIFDLKLFKEKSIKTILKTNDFFLIGTENGIFKVVIGDNSAYILKELKVLKQQIVANVILNDNAGIIWIATKNNGLFKYDEKKDTFHHFKFNPKNKLGISSNRINALYKDNFGVLWIGTAQGGVNKLDINQKKFINYTNNPYDKESLGDNLITSILEDSKGKLWLSGYNIPLFRSTTSINEKNVNNLKFENLKTQHTIKKDDVVRCIYEDKKGFIWIGSDNSLTVYNPINNRFKEVQFSYKTPYSGNFIRAIIETDSNEILIAGNKIVIIENPWEQIKKSGPLNLNIKTLLNINSSQTRTILKDTNGVFWIGTNKGLLKTTYNGDKIIINDHYSNQQNEKIKLSYNNIFSLHKNNNILWVGTFGGGLNKITINKNKEPVKIAYFRKNDVLPDDAIYGILQQQDSLLWLSTDLGLVKFNTSNEDINVFDARDGLSQNNFRQGAYFKGKSGYFYFGGLNGLTIFNPEKITLNTQVPQVLVSDLLINNKAIRIGEKFNNEIVLNKSISEIDELSISQLAQIITFNVVAKHTSTPAKNKLAYKLEGFNDTWIETEEGKETIAFTNLSAGSYKFIIKAGNADSVWSASREISLKILPPWYLTWWSLVLYVLLIIVTIISIMTYFIQHQKLKEKLKYEEIDKQRIETVNQGKFRYFTNLSHEFRTPLTLIAGPLERVIEQNTEQSNNKYFAIIEKNTKRLLTLVDQLITFRQAEQGLIDLNLVKSTLGEFIYPTTEAFENYALEKNINFFYKVNQSNEEIVIDVEKVERIIFNLLSNAFKNTPAQGNISIEAGVVLSAGKKIIHIDVVDTGKGIPEENLKNIFERFYQLGNSEKDLSGGGIGLAFCKSLLDILGGEISAKSKPEIETRFSVVFPSQEITESEIENPQDLKKSFIKNWVPLSNDITEEQEVLPLQENQKKYNLLIVENEVDIQHFLKSVFSKKYNITIANNGIEGLEKMKLKLPDLIISDVMMPEMDGFEFCEKIKSNAETCHIPVLLLTALGENEDIIKGLEFGADEYLSKPFSIKHLELRVGKLLQNSLQIKNYFAKNSDLPKKRDELELNNKDKEFLEKIIQIVEKNLSNSNFGVEELSKEIGLSTSHFYRRLKQLTGQVPNVYIRNFRLQRAAELLSSNQGFNVVEVMYQIGIESNSYFSSSFKKLHGVTPSQYLKKNKI